MSEDATHLPERGKVWHRYVAIGDSFTEGMSDPDPTRENAFIGWADRLASHLAGIAHAAGSEFAYANLAVRGRLLADVIGPQLDAAIELGPDLVSMVGGGNDILRPKADLDSIAGRLEAAVVRLRDSGADVLLATPTDPAGAPLLRHLRGRHAIHSANIFSIAQQHGCYVVNQWGMRALRDFRLWSEDRIHMTSEGHRRVALNALSALGHDTDRADWSTPLPPAPVLGRREATAANAAWARTHLAPWVQRRLKGRSSGDTVIAKRPLLTPVEPS
ncbi:SGNH/GDSL hydrolase family protein [Pedococcus sp. 5OH_020]|uniref:SGNH/GDSL hydrolase family protein n=1 Tax=Pedococcus sp. 5OH_020 TaxID=2989814 RepID=UPI0022E9D067|nr:SGNH/GDSL hydrolase family protein [Pedococcus sp. 5OH_020]